MMMDRNMSDAASRGALMDKTPTVVRNLILNMASNTQQFGTRGVITSRVVNEVATIDNLRVNITSEAARCRIASTERMVKMEHPIDMCPTLQKTEPNSAKCIGAIGGYQYVSKTTVSTESESRAIYVPTIWIHPEHAGSESEQLLVAASKISSAIIPPATATSRIASQHYNSNVIGWCRKHSLSNSFKFEWGSEHCNTAKWSRVTTTVHATTKSKSGQCRSNAENTKCGIADLCLAGMGADLVLAETDQIRTRLSIDSDRRDKV
ncbi:hypothetical protein CR513_31668, partial [Mucuna pruriens]